MAPNCCKQHCGKMHFENPPSSMVTGFSVPVYTIGFVTESAAMWCWRMNLPPLFMSLNVATEWLPAPCRYLWKYCQVVAWDYLSLVIILSHCLVHFSVCIWDLSTQGHWYIPILFITILWHLTAGPTLLFGDSNDIIDSSFDSSDQIDINRSRGCSHKSDNYYSRDTSNRSNIICFATLVLDNSLLRVMAHSATSSNLLNSKYLLNMTCRGNWQAISGLHLSFEQ